MYIAIDTSTDYVSLAVVEDGGVIAESTWRCGQNHTVQLLPALSQILERTGMTLKETKGIIVARGPGSYNGLRVGLSTAKGLAFSLGVPLVGISTLAADAYQQASRGLPVCALLNAGRGEVAAAVYQLQGQHWNQLIAEHITSLETLCSRVTVPTVFCGEFAPAMAAELRSRLGDRAMLVSAAANMRRAGYLAELGLLRLNSQDFDDPATLQPLYLRAPAITVPKHHE